MRVALGLGTIIILVFGFYLLGNLFRTTHEEHAHIDLIEEIVHDDSHPHNINIKLMTEKELDDYLSNEEDIDHLITLFNETDEYNKFKMASRVLDLNNKKGFGLLISILQDGELPFVKEEVSNKIKEFSGKDFGYDAMNEDKENQKAIDEMIKWKNDL